MRRGFRAPDFSAGIDAHTTTRASTAGQWKQFTTLMNAPHTMFVLDYALPCGVVVPQFEIEVRWRVLHVDDTSSFGVEGQTNVPVANLFVSPD